MAQDNVFGHLMPGNAPMAAPVSSGPVYGPPPKAPPAPTPLQLRDQTIQEEDHRWKGEDRNKPSLPAGYQMGPDGKTAMRIPGLPPEKQDAQNQKFEASRQTAVAQARRVLDKIDEIGKGVYHDGGWFETGRSGALVRGLPDWLSAGTDAYDLKANLGTINANSAIAALQEMRNNSPTGGAVGQVSEGEYPMLASATTGANIDPNMSHEKFLTNLAQTKNAWLQQLARIDPEGAKAYLGKEGIWSNPRRGSYFYGVLPNNGPKTQQPASNDGWTVKRIK